MQQEKFVTHNTVRQTWDRAIEPPASLPESADVVIIGGGIVGVSTAWFLSRQGVSVALCEKGHIAGEQSGRNWGWVRQQGRDTRELPMMMESMRIWQQLKSEIGEDVGFTRRGCLFAARTDKDMAAFEDWIAIAKEHDLDTRILGSDEIAEHVRGSARKWRGGLFTASDGRAEPHIAAPALARAAARNGVQILTGCAVRGIETEAGRLTAVVTEHGRIKTSVAVCAAGAWTSLFCGSLGMALPQLRVRGTVVRTAPGPDVLDGDLFDESLGIRRRADGGYTVAHGSVLEHPVTPSSFRWFIKFWPALKREMSIVRLSFGRTFFDELTTPRSWPMDVESPFEKIRVLDPKPSEHTIKGIRRNLARLFPELSGIEFVESWAGMIESTPDVIPAIGEVTDIPGFHVATGFSGHGFGIGPGAGKAIAGLLTGSDTAIDLEPFRLSRFYDGSPMQPQGAI